MAQPDARPQRDRRSRRLAAAAAIAAASTLLVLLARETGRFEALEYATWRWRARFFSSRETPSSRIRLVLVDQDSLDWGLREMGLEWPWPREAYGGLVDFCTRGGAAAVALDILFTEPSLRGMEDDHALGAALQRNGRSVTAFFAGRQGDASAWPTNAPTTMLARAGSDASVPAARTAARAAFPVDAILTPSWAVANVGEQSGADGIAAAAPYCVFAGRQIPSLGLAAWLTGTGGSWELRRGDLVAGGRRVPLDGQGRMILRYKGIDGRHANHGADEVLRAELQIREGAPPSLDPLTFSNAFVLIGFSAPGLKDVRVTPVSPELPGAEIHAALLDNLLRGDSLAEAGWPGVIGGTLALAVMAACAGLLPRSGRGSLLACGACLPVPLVLGFGAYQAGYWWPMVATAAAMAVSWTAGIALNFATEGRQRMFLKQAFRQYLGPEVIEQILADPSRLRLGGERRELTVFFSDIESFTTISERIGPEGLTTLLNRYLSAVGAIIKSEGGYVDKYIGDAVVAFWNAPVPQPDHAARACRAALACQAMLVERRAEFESLAGGPVRVRIGLHTGEVVVGNMGSDERFNYTILGDAANVASRLEGANKVFGTFTMVSESAWAAAGTAFVGRRLGRLRVVGREAAVGVYELRGPSGSAAPAEWSGFDEGLRLFQEGRFDAAAACFARDRADPAAAAYCRRCKELAAQPVPEGWSGVWELAGK